MIGYLLNCVYLAILALASPGLIYAAIRKGKYREGFAEKLLGRVPRRGGEAKCVWLHAVSVGEVKVLVPLVRELAGRRPDWEVVISTTTRTGRELARQCFPQHTTFYCPMDFTWSVRTALRRVRPDYLVLAELELWPNLIRLAHGRGAKVAVINGRLSDKSFPGYRRIRRLIGWLLRQLHLIACQNETYAARFRELGASDAALCVTGSIKFDGLESDRHNPATLALRRAIGVGPEDVVLVAGSTHASEETAAVEVYRELATEYPQLRLVLVPRHPERFVDVARELDASGLSWQRRSELKGDDRGDDSGAKEDKARILLVDSVGELSAVWGLADIAFVGGSLIPHGGQNMIEPAAYGAAVCFGLHTRNFQDVVANLLAQRAAVVVEDRQALAQFVRRGLSEPSFLAEIGARAAAVVAAGPGATKVTVDRLLNLEPSAESTSIRQREAA
ncbi:MAG: 3-deoxy-D-manno-octulosonic acid transferase [Planctomycetota bacterium]|nr:MAG: 3-deoxy-D-manno-octulosonic acid transferase [Planctomycetota bacterium]